MQDTISHEDDTCSDADTASGVGREVPTEDDDRGTRCGDEGRAEDSGEQPEDGRNDQDDTQGQRGHSGDGARRVGGAPIAAEVTTHERLCQLDNQYRHDWRRGAGDRPDPITSQAGCDQDENSHNEPGQGTDVGHAMRPSGIVLGGQQREQDRVEASRPWSAKEEESPQRGEPEQGCPEGQLGSCGRGSDRLGPATRLASMPTSEAGRHGSKAQNQSSELAPWKTSMEPTGAAPKCRATNSSSRAAPSVTR